MNDGWYKTREQIKINIMESILNKKIYRFKFKLDKRRGKFNRKNFTKCVKK